MATNFEEIARTPETLAAFLRSLPVLDGPWDEEFQRQYVGTPAATAIGFYSWKAKAENVVKIKQANQTATEGMPVDLNNIQP